MQPAHSVTAVATKLRRTPFHGCCFATEANGLLPPDQGIVPLPFPLATAVSQPATRKRPGREQAVPHHFPPRNTA